MTGMKIEEIRSALEDASPETLADALAIVLTEGKTPDRAIAGMDKPELANFAQAVIYLKKNYDFEELERFATEADLVYVNAGDRRILLTDRMNTPSPGEGNSPGSQINEAGEHGGAGPAAPGGRFSNLEI
jgi:hypothetical protein